MPKEQYSITSYEKGIDSSSDPRDIKEGFVAGCTNMMVDEVGKIRTMGGAVAHVSDDSTNNVPTTLNRNNPDAGGYGLFTFSHDRLGAHGMDGTHTGSNGEATVMTDSSALFVADALIGARIFNVTDGSAGDITDNSTNTVTVAALAGGDNEWDTGDVYQIKGLPETSDDYLMAMDAGGNAKLWCYSFDNNSWGQDELIDFGTGYWGQPTFFQFDGGIRIVNGNFDLTSGTAWTPKWYGHIERHKFFTEADVGVYKDFDWFVKDNYIEPPPAGNFYVNKTFSNADTGAAGKVNVSIIPTEDDDKPEAEWQKKWECGITYIYDSTQETLITKLSGHADWSNYKGTHTGADHATIMTDSNAAFTADEFIGLTIENDTDGSSGVITGNASTTVTVAALNGGGDDDSWDTDDEYTIVGTNISKARFQLQMFSEDGDRCNERLTHVKVYIREVGEKVWYVQGVWDLKNGGRLINGDVYDFWVVLSNGGDDSNTAYNTVEPQVIPQILHTWETETGMFNDEKSIDVAQAGDGYKCVCVLGRTVYIGNVRRTNHAGDTIIEADAIYKSIPDQPDVFPASWRIDAAVHDGEGITALHKWGKDLLQFKHRTLYIIDTSGETEILKATHKMAGVRGSWAVCETPFGVCWANNWGLWMYDGELKNLMSQDQLGSTHEILEATRK